MFGSLSHVFDNHIQDRMSANTSDIGIFLLSNIGPKIPYLSRYCDMLGIANYILQFYHFFNCKSFPQSKTLLASSVSSNIIHFYLTSEHLAPSSGLKSQLIFIILFYKRLTLRIYLIKYCYLVSMNPYNIVMQNNSILRCIDFFSPSLWKNPTQLCKDPRWSHF